METKFVIVTESGSDLPKELCEKYNIKIVPMHVNFGEVSKKDSETSGEEVFQYFDKTKTLASTSGSTPNDFAEMFTKIREEFPEANIIYIAYSSITTVSYNSAKIAAEDFDNIHFVDSKNVSVGLGFIVRETAKFIESNPELEATEVIKFVEDIRERTRFVFMPQTLEYLRAGGRVSNASYLGAKLFKIYPTIKLEDGKLIAGKKYRGKFVNCYQKMLDDFFEVFDVDKSNITIAIVDRLSDEDMKIIEDHVSKHGVNNPQWHKVGAVISTHGGPGAFGIVGLENK